MLTKRFVLTLLVIAIPVIAVVLMAAEGSVGK
jgi:hypothetical protein